MEEIQSNNFDLSKYNFVRLANNFLQKEAGGNYSDADLNRLNSYLNHILIPANRDLPKYKVGIMLVCINPPYWQYIENIANDIRARFLPGHDVELMLWSDLPNYDEGKGVTFGTTVFPTDSMEWPMPTLMRYNLFLGEEEYLKKFDYLFYIDTDMRMVSVVGDEILGPGLTIAPHPGYAVRKQFWPPYEPNPASASYIKRPGKVVIMDGKPRFMPFYAAGGFQGGKREKYITAMKESKELISKDLLQNYIPIWNDETAWNKYVFDMQTPQEIEETIFLTPSYVYPDSLIKEYYEPLWGCSYTPKIITLTKPFSITKEGGAAIAATLSGMQKLQ